MSDNSLSPSRLATYATCPRQYEYSYPQDVNTPDRTELYLNQGRIYHQTIEDVCDATERGDDAEEIHARAMRIFEEKWNEHSNPDDYESTAHREYQRIENQAAIDAFFDPDGGDGIHHARRSVATECWVECEHDGRGLHGKADNVIRTDRGSPHLRLTSGTRVECSLLGQRSIWLITSTATHMNRSVFGTRSRRRPTLRA